MTTPRRLGAFDAGRGIEAQTHECSECGYSHTNRKNFRRSDDGEGYTCSTGHYTTKDGEKKRQANFYAKRT